MLLPDSLKAHLSQKFGIKADAPEHEFTKLLGKKLASNEINHAEMVEKSTAPNLEEKLQELGLDKTAVAAVRRKLKSSKDGTTNMTANTSNFVSPKDAFRGADVIPASREYSTTKSVAINKSGKPVMWQGRQVETQSQLELAKYGAFLRLRASQDRVKGVFLTDHDQQLIHEMIEKDAWCGEVGKEHFTNLKDREFVKSALLNDSGTGGAQLNPVFFDEAVQTYPLLYGEIYPLVTIVDMPRGNTVQAAGVNNVNVTWLGQNGDGTASPEIDATNLVNNLNANVADVVANVEISRDLMADTPINVGQTMSSLIGIALSASLDKVIVSGDGTSQPQGLANAAGLTALSTVCGTSGPMTCGDIETLFFGIPKQYRIPPMRCAFISNDTMYRRVRAIPQGERDARRLFGTDENSYVLMNLPWCIQNDIPDGTIYCAALARYRMYKRQGSETRFCDLGQTLMLKNTALFTVRARYAGRFTGGGACSYFTDGATADLG